MLSRSVGPGRVGSRGKNILRVPRLLFRCPGIGDSMKVLDDLARYLVEEVSTLTLLWRLRDCRMPPSLARAGSSIGSCKPDSVPGGPVVAPGAFARSSDTLSGSSASIREVSASPACSPAG